MKLKATIALALAACIIVMAAGCIPSALRGSDNRFEKAVVVNVIDGDTILVRTNDGERYCRAIGIDAPESVHPDESRNVAEGDAASNFLKSVLDEGSTVYLQRDVSDTDKYDRLLRYIWLDPVDNPEDEASFAQQCVNAIAVREGFAQATQYPPDTRHAATLASLEADAVSSGRGVSYLWS